MKRSVAAFCALVVFACLITPLAGAEPSPVERERAALKAAHLDADEDLAPDYAKIAAALKTVLADPAFAELTANEQYDARTLYALTLIESGASFEARSVIAQALAMPQADQVAWKLRFRAGFRLRDYLDAAKALTVLARRWPAVVADFTDDAIFNVPGEIGKQPGAEAVHDELIEALYEMHWHPATVFWNADEMWMELVRIRLDRGDLAGAGAVARDLKSPRALVILHADNRFAPIVAADPLRFDVMANYAALLDYERKAAAAEPRKLQGVDAVAEVLLIAGRAREALDILTGALARLDADPDTFTDADDQINFALDLRSQALFALGRGDTAIAYLAAGAAHFERNRTNVSEVINLADAYVRTGKPDDALAALAQVDPANVSSYGHMAFAQVRACALVERGDTASLAPVIAYLKAHIQDGVRVYRDAMLCTGDLDAVAAQVVAELDDLARRPQILFELQDYLPEPFPTAHSRAMQAAWLAVRRRPDVAAAIARVGTIDAYAISRPQS